LFFNIAAATQIFIIIIVLNIYLIMHIVWLTLIWWTNMAM